MNDPVGRPTPVARAVVLAVALSLPALTAYAQAPRPERPYRGLFGTGTSNGAGTFDQQLTAHASLGAAYDDNLLAEARGSNAPTVTDLATSYAGGVGTMAASLNYFLTRTRFSANATGGTYSRYYPTSATKLIRRDYARGSVNGEIGKGVSVGADAGYQPYSLYSLLPTLADPRGADVPINEDFPDSRDHYVSYGANVMFSHQFSVRTSLNLDAGYRVRDSPKENPFRSQTAGGQLSHNLTRDLSLELGYHYTQGIYSDNSLRPVHQLIIAGVNYHRALSVSRSTQVSFHSGMGAVSSPTGEHTRFHAIGGAELSHEIGRTWSTALIYDRRVMFAEDWPEPMLTDAVMLGLNGLITSRLQAHANASAAIGSRAYGSGTKTGFRSYYGSAGMSYAVNRNVSANVTYAYYNHEFKDLFLLAPGFPPQAERNSVHASVSFWAPVFQRSRRQ